MLEDISLSCLLFFFSSADPNKWLVVARFTKQLKISAISCNRVKLCCPVPEPCHPMPCMSVSAGAGRQNEPAGPWDSPACLGLYPAEASGSAHVCTCTLPVHGCKSALTNRVISTCHRHCKGSRLCKWPLYKHFWSTRLPLVSEISQQCNTKTCQLRIWGLKIFSKNVIHLTEVACNERLELTSILPQRAARERAEAAGLTVCSVLLLPYLEWKVSVRNG